jgi:hypothetical protein
MSHVYPDPHYHPNYNGERSFHYFSHFPSSIKKFAGHLSETSKHGYPTSCSSSSDATLSDDKTVKGCEQHILTERSHGQDLNRTGSSQAKFINNSQQEKHNRSLYRALESITMSFIAAAG